MVRFIRWVSVLASVIAFSGASAQTPAADPSARLRQVLPADVADRVIARIAKARARELPAAALENRALNLAARNVSASAIEKSIDAQAKRMEKSRDAIEKANALDRQLYEYACELLDRKVEEAGARFRRELTAFRHENANFIEANALRAANIDV